MPDGGSDDEPNEFDKKEADTRPDHGTFCPACEGSGERLVQLETGTWVPRICDVCMGRKRLTAEELAKYKMRQTLDDEG